MQQLLEDTTRLAVLVIDCTKSKPENLMSSAINTKVAPKETPVSKVSAKKPNSSQKILQDKSKAKSPKPTRSPALPKSGNQTLKKKPAENNSKRGSVKVKAIATFSKFGPSTFKSKEEEVFGEENSQNDEESKKNEEYSLHHQLIPVLRGVSRQKLRSLRMALRKIHSSSEDGFVSITDCLVTFSELHFDLPNRLLDFLIHKCQIKGGKVHHEKLISYIERAHSLSGRDSIEAIDAEEIDTGLRVQSEITDLDLLQRAEIQLIKSREPFDLESFRKVLKEMDKNRSGILKKDQIEKLAVDYNVPIYGSLLHSVLSKSDQTKNDDIRWPEFINFMEKVYESITEKDPHFIARLKRKENAKPLPSREILLNKFRTIALKARAFEKEKLNSGILHSANNENKSKIPMGIVTQKNSSKTPKPVKKEVKKSKPPAKIVKQNQTNKSKISNKNMNKKEICNLNPQNPEICPSEPVLDQSKDVVNIELPGIQNIELWPSEISIEKSKSPFGMDLPTCKLKIEWIYGFRGRDALCNLGLLSSGELVYFTGRVVVLFDLFRHSQRHYCEHSHDVECLAVHTDGIVVASAAKEDPNTGHKWTTRIWRSDSLSALYIFFEELNLNPGRPIYMEFSTLKNWLVILDDSKEHLLTLWEIKGQKLGAVSTSRNRVLSVCCSKTDENVFLTIGYEHITWWEFRPIIGEIRTKCIADYRGFLKARITYSALITSHNELITGDSNGTIYIWASGKNAVTNYIKHAHENVILSLCVYKSFLFTGDSCGLIMLWLLNKTLDNLSMIMLPSGEGGVRRMLVTYSSSNQPILIIGTTTNSLLQLLLAHGKKALHPLENVEFGFGGLSVAISQGHYGRVDNVSQVLSNESWFITAGRDGQICVFDSAKCLSVQKTMLKEHQFTSVCWMSNDNIALGTLDGRCIVLEQQEINLVESFNKTILSCSVSAIFRFLNIQKILVGGIDGSLVILEKKLDYDADHEEKWSIETIQTKIFGIDFIQEGRMDGKIFLWLSNKSGAIAAYEMGCMKVIENLADIRNVKWTTDACGLIPDIAGAWSARQSAEESITTASIHTEKDILAVGTSKGTIALYRFPCLNKEAYCHSNSTSNPVTSVLFLTSGKHLLSISGEECCITQWFIEQ